MKKLVKSLIFLSTMLTGCKPHSDLRGRVQALLDRELPLGSTPQRALEVLDSSRVKHSAYLKDANRIITANYGESYRFFLVSSSVYVTLYFDSNDRLLRAKVEEIGSGP